MDLKIPSAMVERHMFPKHTKSTEIGLVSEVMIWGFFCLSWSFEIRNDRDLRRATVAQPCLLK